MLDALISIIVPIYNTPKEKLDACIEGLLQQTHQNLEIILVDDGSKEPLRHHIDRYALRDVRIHVYHQENSGVSVARNTGMDMAGGEYVTFVDADDCINAEWLEKASYLAAQQNADIVFGKVIMCQKMPEISQDADCGGMRVFEGRDLWKVQEALLLNETDLLPGLKNLDLGPYGKLFRRSSIGENRFPVGIKLSEDQAFVHSILKNSLKCVVMSGEAYYYIENTQSVSHSCHPDAVDVIEKAMLLLSDNLFQCSEILQAYAFRVIDDMMNAIQLAYFSVENSVKAQIEGVQYARSKPVLSEAFGNLKESGMLPKMWRLKMWLLKRSPAMFVIFKRIYQLARR